MSLAETLKTLVEDAGEKGLDELVSALEELKPKSALQEVALTSLIGALENHGIQAIAMASKEVVSLLDGEAFADVSHLSALARSDLLAAMQLEEADVGGARHFVEAVANKVGRFAIVALRVALG